MRAALKLDARELAVRFAQAGADKPADPAKPDRYPFYAALITGALSEGDTADGPEGTPRTGRRTTPNTTPASGPTSSGCKKAQLHAKRGSRTRRRASSTG